jgi:thiol-disulfide isomerase/thioredoxin
MAAQPPPSAAKKGSMVPFFVVLAVALGLLMVYLLFMLGKAAGGVLRGSAMEAGDRRALPPAVLIPVVPSGEPVELMAYRGDVQVLHFWATWCGPCLKEYPDFADYASSSQVPAGVQIYAISLDDAAEVIPPFLSGVPNSPVVYMDQSGLVDQLQITSIPTTIVVDKAGRIAWRSSGMADWSERGVPKVVEELAGE